MALAGTSSIMISSKPASEDSPMSRLMNARYKDTGKRVYKTRIFTTICNNCRLRGRAKCTHNVEMAWSSQQQSAKIEAIMADQPDTYRREILNEAVESSMVKAFSKDSVDALDGTGYVISPATEIKHVFIGIDPAAGGSRSMFSIVSLVVIQRHRGPDESHLPAQDIVIVAADYCDAKLPEVTYNMLVSHMKMLASMRLFDKARLIVIPENNLAFEANNIENDIRRHFSAPDDYICLKTEQNRMGMRTDNTMKQAMATGLKYELDNCAIHFWELFMSVEARTRNGSHNITRLAEEETRDRLTNEIRSFLRITRAPRDPTRDPTVQYTGKLYGGFDDMIMALMIANSGRKVFFNLEEYTEYH